MKQPKALIVYASLSGCTEEIASFLGEQLENQGATVKVVEVSDDGAQGYLLNDICVMATYSFEYEDQILPEETVKFYNSLPKLDLKGKVFGCLGSGQDFYEDYGGAIDRFDEQFEKTGAQRGTNVLKIEFDMSSPEDEENIENFAKNLMSTYRETVAE